MTFTTWVIFEKNQTIYKYKLFDNTYLFDKDLMNLQIEGWNTGVIMGFNDIICIKTEDYHRESIISIPFSLKEISIKNTDLKELPLFPKGIKKIQIINSKIEIDDTQLQILKNCYPSAHIQIINYKFMEKDWRHQRERHVVEAVRNINDIIHERGNVGILNNSQTVHISSINKCVLDAINIIKEESSKYQKIIDPEYVLFHEEKETETKSSNTFFKYINEKICNLFFKKKEKSLLEISVESWCNDYSEHSLSKLTFKQLFAMIMTIIVNHPAKEDMKVRLKIELQDSIGLCFTGRMNRMVNALVGFIDGIQIGLSVKEETQMKISMIVKRLMEKKIKRKEAKKEMEDLFSGLGKESNITEDYKDANLSALNEFGEDDEENTNMITNMTNMTNIFEGDLIEFE